MWNNIPVELLEVFYAHIISPICIAFVTSLVCIIIQMQYDCIYGIYSLLAYVLVGIVLPIYISKQSRHIGVEYRKEAANLNSYVLEEYVWLKGKYAVYGYRSSVIRLE